MTCESCADSVEGALRNIGAEGQVDLASQTVRVEYDESRVDMNSIRDAIEGKGYRIV
ncbi:cation transporter [Paenibacillus mucilaginosus]|nr:copper ion binding protein [Paenibacillus mucilaginosus KNP414]AFH63504.1 CopZ [Paenibacillus mucilaginosus K02]MCG7211919.1 cation transporter [Paenibacillus mucilaginosus]WDM31328.1 heavy-metal-associated domain-containing protein [Paenibacillus mucilaginosus]WFA22682.1 copper chaperone [Paenibacillus mucilaginosus]